nr:hypothetical protein [Catenulispora rubra]
MSLLPPGPAGRAAIRAPRFLRIADAHSAASGLTAAESVALPAREVLGNAGVVTIIATD